MAALTLYGNNGSLGTGYNTMSLTDAGGINLAQGWTVGTTAAGNYSVLQGNTNRAAATFAGTAPSTFSQYGYRTDFPISGAFANTDWTAVLSGRSGATYYDMQGKIGFKLWRSSNANGSGATQITAGWNMSEIITFSSINQIITKTFAWSPGAIVTLSNEYLWWEILWEITTAAANSAAVVYCPEQAAANNALTTPDFTPASAAGGGLIVPKRYGMGGLL